MNIVDENIVATERARLQAMRIHYRHIGSELGWSGMKDLEDIIPLLHTLRRPTFFTRDQDFYRARLRHSGYCLVWLDVAFDEAAEYIHRLLRHSEFRTQARRMGKVVRVRRSGLAWWAIGVRAERATGW
jgi:hypothetical protein